MMLLFCMRIYFFTLAIFRTSGVTNRCCVYLGGADFKLWQRILHEFYALTGESTGNPGSQQESNDKNIRICMGFILSLIKNQKC